ncbi:deoR-like helix-turn-helix domain protein [Neisseria meningitidis 992008]|nr:deoR-like helix-turn-helix domain protein [Neisseria meningitidis 992008]
MKPKIQRHGEILSLVRRHQFMSVDELAAALDVTPQTIRRDIRELEEGGSLKRHHGGASSGGNLPEGLPASRQTRCQNEKTPLPG